MSEQIEGEQAAEVDPNVAEALRKMQGAMQALSPDERKVVREFMAEVDAAMQVPGSGVADKQLEFCYAVKFSQDRLANARLLAAAESYIAAVEGA